MQGRVIPLRRGFVGVVNRSQEDINNHISIREALEKESNYFKNHPVYRSCADSLGTQYLSRTLNGILMQHIRDCLPEIKTRINSMIVELNHEIETMGKSTASLNGTELGGTLLQLVGQFSKSFSDAIDGRATNNITMRYCRGILC
jgi:dynamin 1-like protein